jgi:hypothetical protein
MSTNNFMRCILLVATLAIAAAAAASATTTTNDVSAEKKERYIFNGHYHTQALPDDDGDGIGTITGNEGSVSNNPDSHVNNNFNSHRENTQKTNQHDIPASDNDK